MYLVRQKQDQGIDAFWKNECSLETFGEEKFSLPTSPDLEG